MLEKLKRKEYNSTKSKVGKCGEEGTEIIPVSGGDDCHNIQDASILQGGHILHYRGKYLRRGGNARGFTM